MSRLKLTLGILLGFLALEVCVLAALTLLFYQVTPKSTLAQATFIGRMQPFLKGVRFADRSLNMFYRGPEPAEPLPQYRLEIAPKDMVQIEAEVAAAEVFITDDAKLWADAVFTAEGERYDVKVRVRGDRFNHWKFRKKSWRVKFQKEHLFRGMRELTLIIPEDRGWFAEPLNSYRAGKLGLLQPPMRFVSVSLNGSGPLVYLEVEHWTKEMLEKQARPGDVNFYKTGGVGTSSFDGWDPIFEDIAYWGKFTESVASPHDSYEELDLLFSLMQEGAHARPEFRHTVGTVLDPSVLVRWYAHSLLSGNLHVGGDNLRFFFDPSKGRFEPIPWDVFLVEPRPLLTEPGNPLWNEVFAIPEWRLAVHRFLWDYVNDEEQVQGDLAEADRLRSLVERAAYRDAMKLPSNRQVKRDLDARSRQVRSNIDFLREQLQISELLVVQRVPSDSERAKGVALTVDITVRGPVASALSGMVLPLSLGAGPELSVMRDDGDGILDLGDASVSFRREKGTTQDLLYFEASQALLAPGQPETDASGEPLSEPHTRHRFFIRGLASVSLRDLPLSLDLRNAVTGAPSNVIRTVVSRDAAYEDTVPLLR